ncbi:MAG: hypothetical protein PHY34_03055 [Patescibacteria group bacterium]|nr:hypothetical protein [Patescibacteria group bacterium]
MLREDDIPTSGGESSADWCYRGFYTYNVRTATAALRPSLTVLVYRRPTLSVLTPAANNYSSQTLEWFDNNNDETGWQLQYDTENNFNPSPDPATYTIPTGTFTDQSCGTNCLATCNTTAAGYDDGTKCSVTVSGLIPNSMQYFRVRSTHASSGYSPYSTTVSQTTAAAPYNFHKAGITCKSECSSDEFEALDCEYDGVDHLGQGTACTQADLDAGQKCCVREYPTTVGSSRWNNIVVGCGFDFIHPPQNTNPSTTEYNIGVYGEFDQFSGYGVAFNNTPSGSAATLGAPFRTPPPLYQAPGGYITNTSWIVLFGGVSSVYQCGAGTLTLTGETAATAIAPNSQYGVSLFSRDSLRSPEYNQDPVGDVYWDNDWAWGYSRARNPQPMTIGDVTSGSIEVYLNTGTGLYPDNPSSTDYAFAVTNDEGQTYFFGECSPEQSTSGMPRIPDWGKSYASACPWCSCGWSSSEPRELKEYFSPGKCFTFRSISRNFEDKVGEDAAYNFPDGDAFPSGDPYFVNWPADYPKVVECMPLMPPDDPSIACNYSLARGYYCNTTFSDSSANPAGAYYKYQYSVNGTTWTNIRPYDNSTGTQYSNVWNQISDGTSLSFRSLACSAATQYIRISAAAGISGTLESDYTRNATDTLPPCVPGRPIHTNNPIEAGPTYPLYWSWTQSAGTAVDHYHYSTSNPPCGDSIARTCKQTGVCVSGTEEGTSCAVDGDCDGGGRCTTMAANASYNLYACGVDSREREGQCSPIGSAANSIEAATGIEIPPANITPTSMIVRALGTFSNIGIGSSGIRFFETLGHSGAGAQSGFTSFGRPTGNQVIDSSLVPNVEYCYQVQARNRTGSAADGTNDITASKPDTPVCAYTRANTPVRPLLRQVSGSSVRLTLRDSDENPAITKYAVCVSRYNDGGTMNSKYLFPDGYDGLNDGRTTVNWGVCGNPAFTNETDCEAALADDWGYCSEDDWQTNKADCIFNGADWFPSQDCVDGDTSGHWAVRESKACVGGTKPGTSCATSADCNGGTCDATSGPNWRTDLDGTIIEGLEASLKYDYKVKAENEDSLATAFGSEATLFLVKNNIVGWAWSSTLGWVSMNCLNRYDQTDYSCSIGKHWGLNTDFDEQRDINPLEGYGWSASGQALADSWRALAAGEQSYGSGNGVEYDSDTPGGPYVWVTTRENRRLLQFRTADASLAGEYEICTSADCYLQGIVYADGYLWIASKKDGIVLKVDPVTHTAAPIGQGGSVQLSGCGSDVCQPWGITFDGRDLWVSNFNTANVARIRTSDSTELNCNGTVPTGAPTRCAVSSNPYWLRYDQGYVWVPNNGDITVSRISIVDGSVASYSIGNSMLEGIASDGTNIWVTRTNGVTVMDRAGAVVANIVLTSGGQAMSGISSSGKYMWVNNQTDSQIYQIDIRTRQLVRTYTNLGAANPQFNSPQQSVFGDDAVWIANNGGGGAPYYTSVIRKDFVTSSVGIGWISLFEGVCSNDSQRGCAGDSECGTGNTCIDTTAEEASAGVTVAGTPPGNVLYGYCYTTTGAAGQRYGVCSSDRDIECTESDISMCPIIGDEQPKCIYETCQTGDACLVSGECRPYATANFNGTTHEVTGWARLVAVKQAGENTTCGHTGGTEPCNWGWIKLGGQYDNSAGTAGPYTVTGVEIDSQQFLGDPDVNPNEIQLYSLLGWGWDAEHSDLNIYSRWLEPEKVTRSGLARRPLKGSNAVLEVDRSGNQHVAWIGIDPDTGRNEVYYAKLVSGGWVTASGDAFDSPGSAANLRVTSAAEGVLSISLALDPSGDPHIAWQDGGLDNMREGGTLYYTYWDPETEDWITQLFQASPAQTPMIKIGASGTKHIVYRTGPWAGIPGEPSAINYKQDLGSGWIPMNNNSANLDVSGTPTDSKGMPTLALDGDTPHIAWEQDITAVNHQIFYRRWNGDANAGAGGWVTASDDVTAGLSGEDVSVNADIGPAGSPYPTGADANWLPDGARPSLAVSTSGVPYIAWLDPAAVLLRRWDSGAGAWVTMSGDDRTNLQVNTNQGYYGRRVSLVLDANNIPEVVWGDYDSGYANEAANIRFRQWDPAANGGAGGWVTAAYSTQAVSNPATPYYNVYESNTQPSEGPMLKLDRWGNQNVIWDETKFSTRDCSAFGTGGQVVEGGIESSQGRAAASDGTYLYTVGSTEADNWWIEKRWLNNGDLVTDFDGDGHISGGADTWIAYDVAVDANYLYISGIRDNNTPAQPLDDYWFVEKRNKTTGDLCNGVAACTAGAFNGTGRLYSSSGDAAYGIAIDGTSMYLVGRTFNPASPTSWRIEKRLLTTGALDTTFDSDGVVTSAYIAGRFASASDIVISGLHMYVIGYENYDGTNFGSGRWRIEKRLLSTGKLDPMFGNGTGFLTGANAGLVDGDNFSITTDGTYLYISGSDSQAENGRWHLEKRDMKRGELVSGFGGANGDPAGTISVDVGASTEDAHAIALDGDMMYIAGETCDPATGCTSRGWYLEKRLKSTGALCTDGACGVSMDWGNGGAGTVLDWGGWAAYDVVIANPYVYFIGRQDSTDLRVDKRSRATGSLLAANDVSVCTDEAYPQCLERVYRAYVCASSDLMFTKWFPGVRQAGVGWVEFMPATALLGIPWVQTMFSDIYAGTTVELAPPARGSGSYTSTFLITSGQEGEESISGIPGYYSGTETGRPTSGYYQTGFEPLITGTGYPLGEDVLDRINVGRLTDDSDGDGLNRYGNPVVEDMSSGGGSGIVDISASAALSPSAIQPVLDGTVYYFHGADTRYVISNPMEFMKGTAASGTTGGGLFVIDGDLEIRANITYDETGLENVSEMPSAAFIVRGNIYIDPFVTDLGGAFVAIDNPATPEEDGVTSTGRLVPAEEVIESSTDDTDVSSDSVNMTLGTTIRIGKDATATYRGFLRFPLDIPAGSEIIHAYLRLTGNGVSAGDFNSRIYLIDSTNVATFDSANYGNDPANIYNLDTTNSISFPMADWQANAQNTSPDIKSLVQRFIDMPEYAAGNAIGLMLNEGTAANDELAIARAWDDPVTGNEPQLVIDYAPQRVTRPIVDELDDAVAFEPFYNADTLDDCMRFGSYSDTERDFFRFREFDLPKNADIKRASLRSTICGLGSAGFEVRQGLLDGFPGTFDGGNPFDLPLDRATSEEAQTIAAGDWPTGSTIVTSDIADLIETFISRDLYQPGVAGFTEPTIRLRRDPETVGAGEYRGISEVTRTVLEVDYVVPLKVSGLLVAKGFNFDRTYLKDLAAAEQIVYDGRVLANTPPGLSDFSKALPVYQRVVP